MEWLADLIWCFWLVKGHKSMEWWPTLVTENRRQCFWARLNPTGYHRCTNIRSQLSLNDSNCGRGFFNATDLGNILFFPEKKRIKHDSLTYGKLFFHRHLFTKQPVGFSPTSSHWSNLIIRVGCWFRKTMAMFVSVLGVDVVSSKVVENREEFIRH